MKKIYTLIFCTLSAMTLFSACTTADTKDTAKMPSVTAEEAVEKAEKAEKETPSASFPLFTDVARSKNSWVSPEFTAAPSNGQYIRYHHENKTEETIRMYLHRTDSGKDIIVSKIDVESYADIYATYGETDSGSGTYYIKIEAFPSGGQINGNVSVEQYQHNPDDAI